MGLIRESSILTEAYSGGTRLDCPSMGSMMRATLDGRPTLRTTLAIPALTISRERGSIRSTGNGEQYLRETSDRRCKTTYK